MCEFLPSFRQPARTGRLYASADIMTAASPPFSTRRLAAQPAARFACSSSITPGFRPGQPLAQTGRRFFHHAANRTHPGRNFVEKVDPTSPSRNEEGVTE
jgi:hypothetical protein